MKRVKFEMKEFKYKDSIKKGASLYGTDVNVSTVVGFDWVKREREYSEEIMEELESMKRIGNVRNVKVFKKDKRRVK